MESHNFDVNIVIPSSKQNVTINKDQISVNQQSIACADVAAVKYGVTLVGGKKNPQYKKYTIDIKSKDGKTLNIQFQSSKVQELLAEDHTYYYIMSGLWQYVKKHLVETFIESLNEQKELEVGAAKFNHKGFYMSYKTWFWGKVKTEMVPWTSIHYHQEEGFLVISNANNKKQKLSVSFHNDWNGVVLNTLLHYLWQDHRKEKLQKGEKI